MNTLNDSKNEMGLNCLLGCKKKDGGFVNSGSGFKGDSTVRIYIPSYH